MGALSSHTEEQFRAAMRTFTGTVSVITTCTAEGEWRGMAATAVTSVSLAPPTCLICVNRETTLYPALVASERFCINVMHRDHHELIASFAHSQLRDSRFQLGEWRCDGAGVPFLEDAQSNIFCELFDRFPVGTHDVILGRVGEVKVRADHDPLLYGGGSYYRQAKG